MGRKGRRMYHAGRVTRGELLRGEGAGTRRKGVAVDVRWKILKRDQYRGRACGKSPATDARVELEADHIVPVARGGGNEEGNLRTLCGACNVGKGDERGA
jgi:5-methylcytosine-specific restriction endonuclease McrA